MNKWMSQLMSAGPDTAPGSTEPARSNPQPAMVCHCALRRQDLETCTNPGNPTFDWVCGYCYRGDHRGHPTRQE